MAFSTEFICWARGCGAIVSRGRAGGTGLFFYLLRGGRVQRAAAPGGWWLFLRLGEGGEEVEAAADGPEEHRAVAEAEAGGCEPRCGAAHIDDDIHYSRDEACKE